MGGDKTMNEQCKLCNEGFTDPSAYKVIGGKYKICLRCYNIIQAYRDLAEEVRRERKKIKGD
jgi:hypothetical protein